MRQQIVTFLFASSLLFSLSSPSTAHAELSQSLKVDVPFEFSVGDRTLPAGAYTLKPLTGKGAVLLRNPNGGYFALILAMTVTSEHRVDEKPQLIFERRGDEYRLTRVLAGIRRWEFVG